MKRTRMIGFGWLALAVCMVLAACALPLDAAHPLAVAAGLSAVVGGLKLAAGLPGAMPRTRMHRMSGKIETIEQVADEVEKMGKEFKTASDKVKDIAEKALKQAEEGGGMTKEMKAEVDKRLIEQGTLLSDMAQKIDAFTKSQPENKQGKTSGQIFVEDKGFKEFMEKGGFRGPGQVINVRMKTISGLTADAGGTLVAPDRQQGIITTPNRRLTVRDLLMPGRTSSNLIEFFRELVFTNSAAPVSETVLKPESNITFEPAEASVKTIAHWVPASKQILDDVPGLQSYIDGRMRYGLDLEEEAQLLKGAGTGNNLNGIYTQATAYSLPSGASAPAQLIDHIRAMLLQAELAEYPASGIVLHPTDWYNIEILKDGVSGGYLIAQPQNGMTAARLWGREVVATQAMTQDTALVGAFRMGAQIFDKEDANVMVSSEDSDNFRKNMVTVRAEERLALAVYRPGAFIKSTNLP